MVSYSMFFTQLACPCKEHTFEFNFRKSHNAIVVSSEQVANKRLSKNLPVTRKTTQGAVRILSVSLDKTWIIKSQKTKQKPHLMLLTQSSWASVRVLMCLDEIGSNSKTSVCSQATVSTDLSNRTR